MREIQMHPRKKREPQVVDWLAFDPTGTELVARVDDALRVYDLRTDVVGPLFGNEHLSNLVEDCDVGGIALSADRRLLVLAADYEESNYTMFVEATERDYHLPFISTDGGCVGLMFTPDGKGLVAVWNDRYDRGSRLVRLSLEPILAPKRFVEKRNPLSGQLYKAAAPEPKWQHVLDLSRDERMCAAALSGNGRLVAAGTADGTVHVANLKKKTVVASFAWEGRKLRERSVTRVGFDPAGEWVASIAGGRLFARPLGAGKAWWTKDALGGAHDFAYHPDGRVLCAVFADGQARFLDPRTGAVRQSFKWSKKPRSLHSVCFAPDGLTCAAGGEKGKVVVWDVDI